MGRKSGALVPLTRELRIVLKGAALGQTDAQIAEAATRHLKSLGLDDAISPTTVKRILDEKDPQASKSTSEVTLNAIRKAIGLREETDYRVVLNREEIAFVDAFRAIRAEGGKEAAVALLQIVEERAAKAVELGKHQRAVDTLREGLTTGVVSGVAIIHPVAVEPRGAHDEVERRPIPTPVPKTPPRPAPPSARKSR